MSNNRVHCGGYGHTGINGDEFTLNNINNFPDTPVPNFESRTALMLSGGESHVCGVFENDVTRRVEVICWGLNDQGQLGFQTVTDRVGADIFPEDATDPTPLASAKVAFNLPGSETIIDIQSGRDHNCLLTSEGATNKVRCWGAAVAVGTELDPAGGASPRYSATNFVTAPLDFGDFNPVEIALGNNFTCALFETEVVKCWGQNLPVLGPGPGSQTPSEARLIDFGGGRSATRLFTSASASHVCATLDYDSDEDGRIDIKCWGENSSGQLGLGDVNDRGSLPSEMGFALPLLKYRLE